MSVFIRPNRIKIIQKAMLKESYNYRFLLSIGTVADLSSYLNYTADCWRYGFLSKDYTKEQYLAFSRFENNKRLIKS